MIIIILVAAAGITVGSIWGNNASNTLHKAESYKNYAEIGNLDIWLVTDTHYIAPELTDTGEYYQKMVESGDGKFMMGCEQITDAFIEEVIEEHPDALIISGDLTFNGARESHLAFAKKIAPIRDAGIDVIALPGNHDFTVNRAARFEGDSYELVESIDASEYMDIYGDYGINDSISRDATSLSYVYELADNVRILVVDVNTVAGMPGILTNSTLEYVEEELKKAKEDKAYVIGVTHQTLLTHSELTSQGMIFINNDKLLELYEKYDVLVNLSGHMHIQHIKETDNNFVEIATGSLMTSPNYHGEIHLQNRQMAYKAVSSLDSDCELYKEAKEFLWNNSYRQASELLSDEDNKEEMAGYFANFNVSYIAGRNDLIKWDETISNEWNETDTFVPVYLQVVKDEISDTEGALFTEYRLKW